MPQDLTIEFGNISQTPTIFPHREGELEVTVTNQGDENVTDAAFNLYASTDAVLDDEVLNTNNDKIEGTDINVLQGTDELLGTMDGVSLAAGEESTFTVDFASDEFRNPSVVSAGAYNLIAEVDSDNDIDEGNDRATQFISVEDTDVVLDWNSVFLNAVQAEGKAERGDEFPEDAMTLDAIPGVAPPVEARNAAILHLAVYDAVHALGEDFYPDSSYLEENLPEVPEGASQEAAAVGAAYQVVSELFPEPEQQETFDRQRERSLADINDESSAIDAGFDFGVEVGEAILEQRSNDFAANAQRPYDPGTDPGDYQEKVEPRPDTLPEELDENGLEQTTALLPDWGMVTPFAIDSVASFRAPRIPDFGSPDYAEDIDEVREKGLLTDTEDTTVDRTEDETQIAQFWSYDRPDTFRPPGQWNQITQEVILNQEDLNPEDPTSLEDNARTFALLNVAMADAGIAAWEGKYFYDQLRPITAIRNAADSDNNPDTDVDPNWEPLLPTPNFPDYISGHATFGGAAAGVLENLFEEESFEELVLPSQELPGVTRSYLGSGEVSSFEKAAIENAESRELGGVHVEISNSVGLDIGFDVADSVINSDLFS